ncbi:cytidylate kinase-like family protein [Coraliomargarita algicola]|uniref:Cytidylate kinase-like family protein n=1 Tax=Coraliomargarita algicola TaxID=3092156 RepID=A0ABZ0RQI6_9BACT|nr:cytidylate kinase-like family protein [Coraliomargarita sp. J2-16]WPJ97408.1 cytidylate kinase-like family protein [Coraliomargarita sp. J2-16]
MNTTIAISRLIGSDAGEIAKRLAEALGYDLVDKAILQATLEQYGITRFGKLYNSTPNLWDLTNSKNIQVISMLNDTMKALAYRGRTVILARGAYAALSDYSNVLKVRLQAPLAVRVQRMMAREECDDPEQVEERIVLDDKARKKFVKLFYNKKDSDATDFDLVINTAIISVRTTDEWLLDAVRMFESIEPVTPVQTVSQQEVDPLLLDAIDQALQRRR